MELPLVCPDEPDAPAMRILELGDDMSGFNFLNAPSEPKRRSNVYFCLLK